MTRPIRFRTWTGKPLSISHNEDGYFVQVEYPMGHQLILTPGIKTLDDAATEVQRLAYLQPTLIRSLIRVLTDAPNSRAAS
jgi:hypothetical protein